MALTNVNDVKRFIGISGIAEDDFLNLILAPVEAAVKRYLDRKIESASYTEYYGGTNGKILVLNEYPVANAAAVTDVRVDAGGFYGQASGGFASSTALTQGTDYAVVLDGTDAEGTPARLYKIGGVWPGRWMQKHGLLTHQLMTGVGNIKVTYTAGYASTAIPTDIKLAVWQLCAQVRIMRDKGLFAASESLAEYSYALQQLNLDALMIGTVAQLLSRYRRVRDRYKVLG